MRGTAMTAVTAGVNGGDEGYTLTIAPALPTDLSINAADGADRRDCRGRYDRLAVVW